MLNPLRLLSDVKKVCDAVLAASQKRGQLIPEDSASHAELGEPSATSMMMSFVEMLLISVVSRNPVIAAVWVSESGVDPDVSSKCEQ